jgi:hemerythrin superfamily protein
MLTEQHRELEASFEAVLAADGATRRALFVRCADVLMSHVLVEERYFYPAVRAKRTEDILLESLEEHLSLKRLLADLLALTVTDPRFEAKLHVLKEQSEHHHEEEEKKLFPKVEKLLSKEELDALGDQMGMAQADLLAGEPRKLVDTQTEAAASLR